MAIDRATRERVEKKAREFWNGLDRHQRFAIGDGLVLGDLDWRDWLMTPPLTGFWSAVDRLRMEWESTDG